MDLTAAIATLEAASASVVAALREADLAALSRDDLLSVVESTQRVANTAGGVQTVAVAHLAAVEDDVDQHGVWTEQHRGLGHISLDTAGLIAPAVGISAQAASTRVDVAVHQVTKTPALVSAMLSGDLDPWRARVVTSEVEICPDGGAGEIVDDLVAHYAARGRGWHETAGPMRARVRRMIARAHPDVVADEAEAAREGRSLRRTPSTMGTDHWEGELPVEVSLPMWQAVEALAQQLRRADPELTVDQARADALAQLVLQQADVTIHLHGTVPEDATADANPPSDQSEPAEEDPDSPADERAADRSEPAGEGSEGSTGGVDPASDRSEPAGKRPEGAAGDDERRAAHNARPGRHASPSHDDPPPRDAERPRARGDSGRLAEVGGLGSTTPTLLDLGRLAAAPGVRVIPSTPLSCHPLTGAVTGGVVPAGLARLVRKNAARRSDRYVVPVDMARLVRLRDGRCRFPTCTISASMTDQDHVVPWPIGATTPTNLMCLCRRHHRVKQRRGWRARLDLDGVVHWTDPAGREHTTYPADHLHRSSVQAREPVPPSDPARRSDPAPASVRVPASTQEPSSGSDLAGSIRRFEPWDAELLPSRFEDHLWRALELVVPGVTSGPVRLGSETGAEAGSGVTWRDPVDRIFLELAGPPGGSATRPDDPPF